MVTRDLEEAERGTMAERFLLLYPDGKLPPRPHLIVGTIAWERRNVQHTEAESAHRSDDYRNCMVQEHRIQVRCPFARRTLMELDPQSSMMRM